jgi:asparagine synthase (glutamine-hydrolysing)
MCGIAGIYSLNGSPIPEISQKLALMNSLQKHRGPDGEGIWINNTGSAGLAHVRLSVIDLQGARQPMKDSRNALVFNGEIYNYKNLRSQLSDSIFNTKGDTEVLLKGFSKWGYKLPDYLRGMFAFAIYTQENQELFCVRDRFGIKPFYYTINNDTFYFASEIKALLPFVDAIETNQEALNEYLNFQLVMGKNTLFKNIQELKPGFTLKVTNGKIIKERYWNVYFEPDFSHTEKFFEEKLSYLIEDSVKAHLESDVEIGAYVSGGIDSSALGIIASKMSSYSMKAFTARFDLGAEYDESQYAKMVANESGMDLKLQDLGEMDFLSDIDKIIYHLDYPQAGPGCFPQYEVSKLAAQHCKVVIGGQGGDEIFGGYARYLVAYFEQCIKGAIEGRLNNGNFVVTYESIIPNLQSLDRYKPMIQEFWRTGLFEPLDKRYFHLINRMNSVDGLINTENFGDFDPFASFLKVFSGENVKKASYFDLMTHFDFKTLLPALLQIEDRVSMAHGLESRVPFLDHHLIEFAATIPADVKFKNGELKRMLKIVFKDLLPKAVLNRKDKMGFPVPFSNWMQTSLNEYFLDIFHSSSFKSRHIFNVETIIKKIQSEGTFSRSYWGILSLELWMRNFHDKDWSFKTLIKTKEINSQINYLEVP